MRPLNDLLVGHPIDKKSAKGRKPAHKPTPFKWGEEQHVAIDSIIDQLNIPPDLSHATIDFRSSYTQQFEAFGINKGYLKEWGNLKVKDGILLKTQQEKQTQQLVLPDKFRDELFKAYHDDLGHQGRVRTLSLMKRREHWPGMDVYVEKKITMCGWCIRRKVQPTRAADLLNINYRSDGSSLYRLSYPLILKGRHCKRRYNNGPLYAVCPDYTNEKPGGTYHS